MMVWIIGYDGLDHPPGNSAAIAGPRRLLLLPIGASPPLPYQCPAPLNIQYIIHRFIILEQGSW